MSPTATRILAIVLLGCAAGSGCSDGRAGGGAEDDVCRSQCGPGRGECDEQPLESFGDLDSGRATYQRRCDDGARYAFEAECDDGLVVLRSGTGYSSEGRFYDPDSGEFIGMTRTSDQSSQPCFGKSHWPVLVPCADPIVTHVLCGTTFVEGQSAGRGVTQE